MRFGLIGDVHAESSLLNEALTALGSLDVESILCTGDIVDGVASVDQCCELLSEHRVLTVRGNHDRWLLAGEMRALKDATAREDLTDATIEFLMALPPTIELQTPVGTLLLCHGLAHNDMGKVGLDDFGYALEVNFDLQELINGSIRWVVNGHTHEAGVKELGGLSVINAGTLARDGRPCFLVLDLSELKVERFDLLPEGGAHLAETWLLRTRELRHNVNCKL